MKLGSDALPCWISSDVIGKTDQQHADFPLASRRNNRDFRFLSPCQMHTWEKAPYQAGVAENREIGRGESPLRHPHQKRRELLLQHQCTKTTPSAKNIFHWQKSKRFHDPTRPWNSPIIQHKDNGKQMLMFRSANNNNDTYGNTMSYCF